MADFDPPNAGDNPPPGTPSKRAEKKQDTWATPERMKAKQVEMMEIDPEDVPPSTPPRYNNSDDKDKSGKTVEKSIKCDLTPEKQGKTPQSTPDRQKGKQGGKGSPSKKKTYANCPITWASKLQTTIALSTTEAEYVALSTAMRDVIYFVNLISELKQYGIELPGVPNPNTVCRVFEDNVGALELANSYP